MGLEEGWVTVKMMYTRMIFKYLFDMWFDVWNVEYSWWSISD
jgi:hypothetical protein